MSEIIIYEDPDITKPVLVTLEGEMVWLTQSQMAELFQVKPQNVTIHLKNIYNGGELEEASTCKDFLQVQVEGARRVERNRKFYNLDAIISVGYRVNSKRGVRLYPSREIKAAHLLYFVIKDHPFSDGNKRIGSFLFLLYLHQENMAPRIGDAALTALALLVAESLPANKDLLTRLIVNLLMEA